jgi:hypothetical protein
MKSMNSMNQGMSYLAQAILPEKMSRVVMFEFSTDVLIPEVIKFSNSPMMM